jgi:hypothetical protein
VLFRRLFIGMRSSTDNRISYCQATPLTCKSARDKPRHSFLFSAHTAIIVGFRPGERFGKYSQTGLRLISFLHIVTPGAWGGAETERLTHRLSPEYFPNLSIAR